MPTAPTRISSASRPLTDQEILAPIWAGRRTGNLFKAVEVLEEGGERVISYRKASGATYKVDYATFIGRFREATQDDLWEQILSTADSDQDGESTANLVTVIEPDFRHDLDRMVLYPECRTRIRAGLNRVTKQDELETVWDLSHIEPQTNRCILNFFGRAGTGKTLAAGAVAKLLGKPLMRVDYSEIISCITGDTAKHIKQIFRLATESEAVLMFDEADAIMSRRLNIAASIDGTTATGINQNRNVMLSCISDFDGVAIMCTNFFGNYDEALLRRIAMHIEFKLPDAGMREQLFKLHLPKLDHVAANMDWAAVAAAAVNFSGGDILNAVVNSITRCSMVEDTTAWILTTEDLLAEVEAIRVSKETHRTGL